MLPSNQLTIFLNHSLSSDGWTRSKALEVIESLWQHSLNVGYMKLIGVEQDRVFVKIHRLLFQICAFRTVVEASATLTEKSRVIHHTLQENPESTCIKPKLSPSKPFLIHKLPTILLITI